MHQSTIKWILCPTAQIPMSLRSSDVISNKRLPLICCSKNSSAYWSRSFELAEISKQINRILEKKTGQVKIKSNWYDSLKFYLHIKNKMRWTSIFLMITERMNLDRVQ